MKVNKTQAVLFMYGLLYKHEFLYKEEVMTILEINNLTFLRYIQELRAYLSNFDTGRELLYSNKDKRYILIK